MGYVLYAKIKIAEGFKAVNKITGSDIDYTEYITEEYAQKTIAELMKDLGALSSDFQNQTASLSSLEKFSPKVRETAESIVKKMARCLPGRREWPDSRPFAVFRTHCPGAR